MFKKIDLIILVENKDRELQAFIHLANELKEKHNISSLIISKRYHLYLLFIYRAKLYLFNNYFTTYGEGQLIYESFLKNPNVISHKWEQLLVEYSFLQLESKNEVWYNDFLKNKVPFLTWNQDFKNYLVSLGINDKNIFTTGNIATNLLNIMSKSSDEYKTKLTKEFNIDRNKKIIFIPITLEYVFTPESFIIKKYQHSEEKTRVLLDVRNYYIKSFEAILKFMKALLKDEKNYIVFRPHPGESEEMYSKIFQENSILTNNIIVTKEYTIREWILTSDVIISTYSSTVWDAYCIGKKACFLSPFDPPKEMRADWFNIPTHIKNISDYHEFLFTNENKKDISYELTNSAFDNVTSVIMKKIDDHRKVNRVYILKHLIFIKQFIKSFLCKFFKCKFVSSTEKFDYFDYIRK